MYGWFWRKLPGNWMWKTLQSVVLAVAISGFLVVVVFPWVEPKLPFSGNTVSDSDTPATPATTNPTPSPSTTSVPTPTPDGGGDVLPGD